MNATRMFYTIFTTGTELLSGKAFEAIAAGGNEGWDGTGSIHIEFHKVTLEYNKKMKLYK